jgi:hypothetical protein
LLVVFPSNDGVMVVRSSESAVMTGASDFGVRVCRGQCWKTVLTRGGFLSSHSSLCLFLYSSSVAFECFKLLAGSHESSSGPYPFHLIRNNHCPLLFFLWRTMWSSSYSSSLSIKSGGGRVSFGPYWDVSLYGDRWTGWKES